MHPRTPHTFAPFRCLALLLTLFASSLGTAWAQDAPAPAAPDVRTISRTVLPGSAQILDVDLTLGEIVVEGEDRTDVQVEAQLSCVKKNLEACRKVAEKLVVEGRNNVKRLSLSLRRSSRGRIRGVKARFLVRAPRDLALEIDLRIGDVTVRGMRNNVEIDAGAGDIDATYARDRVQRVKLAVGAGEANLWLDGARIEGSGWPRSVKWNGTGQTTFEVDAGSGKIDLRLE